VKLIHFVAGAFLALFPMISQAAGFGPVIICSAGPKIIQALFVSDAMSSAPLDPYRAPPLFALGSGKAPSGAHCYALVGKDT
jgi:hypothetical protein